jgi:hypothetical protein
MSGEQYRTGNSSSALTMKRGDVRHSVTRANHSAANAVRNPPGKSSIGTADDQAVAPGGHVLRANRTNDRGVRFYF